VRRARYGAIVRRDDFIPPPPADEAAFFRGATIVLDTNVLLAPYKLSATAREDALRAIESSAERLWLPHQVGVEFYRNHASHRDLRSKAYQDAIKQTAQFERLATKDLGTRTTHEDLRKNVARVVREAVSGIDAEIEQLRLADTAITAADTDDVLERIEAALDTRVAPAPDPATIRNRTEEFTSWRVPSRIPPGFEDRRKPGGLVRPAGDFLIWAEMLEHAAANDLDVLFVTEDGKDDWWEIVDGERRPHRDLVLEFQRATGRGYHQVGMETFVRLATEAAGDEADQETLDEIVAVGKEALERESPVERALETWLKLAETERRLGDTPDWNRAREWLARNLYAHDIELDILGFKHSLVSEMDDETKHRILDELKRPRPTTHDENQSDVADQSGDEDA
jgi:rRNA-processing protein FCF1